MREAKKALQERDKEIEKFLKREKELTGLLKEKGKGKKVKEPARNELSDLVTEHQAVKERLERAERQRDDYKKALKRVWMLGVEEVSGEESADEEFKKVFEVTEDKKGEAERDEETAGLAKEETEVIVGQRPSHEVVPEISVVAEEAEKIGRFLSVGMVDTVSDGYDVPTVYVSLSVNTEKIPKGEPLYIIRDNSEKAKLLAAQRYPALNSLVCEVQAITKGFTVRKGDEVVMAEQ